MAWVKIDDHLDEHPKIAAAGPLGLALYVASIAYSNRNLTDGFIPKPVALRLLHWDDPHGRIGVSHAGELGGEGADVTSEIVVETLLRVGLWKVCRGGFRIHDYHDFQPTKAQVMAERKAARERMHKRRSGEVRANIANGAIVDTNRDAPPRGHPDDDDAENAISRGSPELREKFAGSSGGVRQKFADPVKKRERTQVGRQVGGRGPGREPPLLELSTVDGEIGNRPAGPPARQISPEHDPVIAAGVARVAPL